MLKRLFSWLRRPSDSNNNNVYIGIFLGDDGDEILLDANFTEEHLEQYIGMLFFVLSGQVNNNIFTVSLERMKELGIDQEKIAQALLYLQTLLQNYHENNDNDNYNILEEEKPLVDPMNVFRSNNNDNDIE